MRRPSPLPPPPSPERVAGEPAAERTAPGEPRVRTTDASAHRGADADARRPDAAAIDDLAAAVVAPGELDANETAPVTPLDRPAPLPSPDGVDPDDAAVIDDTQTDVRLTDVWRAARARRKALRAEIRRFTVRQRRRRALWLGAGASVLVLALGTIGAAYSPLFAVERIVVVGAEQLSAEELAGALSGQLGTPLPLVDESAVKAELVGFPLVESYTLEARPPHDLVVRIVERTPIGLIEKGSGYTLVDAAGVALSTTATPGAGTPVLTIRGGVDSDAFAAAGQVMRSLPDDIRTQVTAVSASTPDDVTLTLGGTNTQVVWGSAEQSARKALVLKTAMAQRPPADVYSYDVSSPEAIVIR